MGAPSENDETALMLRRRVLEALAAQGFRMPDERTAYFRQRQSKHSIRLRNRHAVARKVELARPALAPHENKLLARSIADGATVDPGRIQPRLIRVSSLGEGRLFRYACLHWSVPVSGGYGRRLRFLIVDEGHGDRLMGLLGLGDPVFSIGARDRWIGWDAAKKSARLWHVMDAYVLGAVPPYAPLLGGKLVALAAACDEVRAAFRERYADRPSVIRGMRREAHLALVMTTSALGRSSLYHRVALRPEVVQGGRVVYANPGLPERARVFQNVGLTQGWGDFHFSNGIYEELAGFAETRCRPTAKRPVWGVGFRNRSELVRKALAALGFSPNLLRHGIRREVFAVPLAVNAREFLRGETDTPDYFPLPFAEAVRFWRARWLLPRAGRDESFRDFRPAQWALWTPPNSLAT